ncbi:unnamed protein product [Tilletia controversa]|nr:hypothetical protein CF328_g6420 [Tilletia controversa]CAD6936322.1 unnamed protein product [Tilletia controversa]CAD6937863.1 unnamed protein product [Tilletia controversa]CAD6986407.1 unnamed protein product [Tilletia controversa]
MQNIDQFELRQGDRDETAVETLQENVAKIRTQRQAQPQFEVEQALAIALVNYSNALRNAKKLGQALAAVQESVSIWRFMHETWPQEVEANLASTLRIFCVRLGEVGRDEEAVKAAEESIRLYRSLRKAKPEAFGRSLAITLMIYSNSLSRSKKIEDALQAIEEKQSAPADGIYAKAVMIHGNGTKRGDGGVVEQARDWSGEFQSKLNCDAEQLLAHSTTYPHGMNLLQRMDIRHDDRAPTFRTTPSSITPPERRFKAHITTISMRSVCIAGTTQFSVDIAYGLALAQGPCLP